MQVHHSVATETVEHRLLGLPRDAGTLGEVQPEVLPPPQHTLLLRLLQGRERTLLLLRVLSGGHSQDTPRLLRGHSLPPLLPTLARTRPPPQEPGGAQRHEE